jgi:tRNA(Ile)-lysidine synthase
VFADASKIGNCVRIRNWRPGDYYKPMGWPGGKIKKLFQKARVPKNQRSGLPVLVAGTEIVWVVSFPVSQEFAAREDSEKIVAFDTLPD